MSREAAMSMLSPSINNPISPGLAPSVEAPVESPIIPVDSDRFAKIASREAKLVKERELFKSEQQKLYEDKAKTQKIIEEYNKFQEMKLKDPIAALKEAGFSETDIFNYMASAEKKEPTAQEIAETAAQAEIKKLRDEMAEREAKDLKDRDDRNVKAFQSEISKAIVKDAEKYEYCAFEGPEAEATIFQTVLEIIKSEPDISPFKAMQEAMELAENYYENRDKEMSKLKKRQPPVPVDAKPPVQTTKAPQRTRTVQAPVAEKKAPTLTPKATATIASTIKKQESASEKRARLESWLRTGVKS